MVRRRGVYQVSIIGKPLDCLFCKGQMFTHREVYIKIVDYDPEVPKKKLILQSFTCVNCGQELKFEERKQGGQSTLDYVKVSD